MKARTRARSTALQVLYEVDLVGHAPAQALQERLAEQSFPDELAEFIRQIVFGVLPLMEQLDLVIARYAPEWPLEQVAPIDRNILRMAAWEFAVQRQTPLKVVINEAVELAKEFGSDSASRFVNGVLGSLAEQGNEIVQFLQRGEAGSAMSLPPDASLLRAAGQRSTNGEPGSERSEGPSEKAGEG